MNALNAKTAETLGAKLWVSKQGEARYYFNNLADLYGLEVRAFKTGNISDAWLRGREISNNRARQIVTDLGMAKIYLGNDGQLHGNYLREGSDVFRVIAAEIRARSEALSHATKKFTSDINRRAWQIRRQAAAEMRCKIMDVSWKICLEMARNGE